MKKLIHGIVDFGKNLTAQNKEFFADLALKQKPDALFIACSDSRVVPNLFASSNPGDLFVLRNIGNLIPPSSETSDLSSISALEYSVCSLNVSDIVVCGHSECGAMITLAQGLENLPSSSLKSWLEYGLPSLKRVKAGYIIDPSLEFHNQLSQVNVLQQMEHIKSYSFVHDRLSQNRLRIHGWWFDIAKAQVFCYEKELNAFVLINEEEAENLIQ